MLSKEDNGLITRTGPGTPAGELFRQYWLPVLLSSELPEPDCTPVRARVLGEDLVAFRATSGTIGLVGNNCPHRGASLFFGRNEEEGLRCVYHGWKFDTAGNCVDMPNEPPESNFKHKIRHTAYPCHEVTGVVWAYMGPRKTPPPFPKLPWTLVPESHHCGTKITEDCNWLQVIEGDLDTAHADFLHFVARPAGNTWPLPYRAPDMEILFTDCGFTKGARRFVSPDRNHWRIYQFLMPNVVLLPAGQESVNYRAIVPMDDEHTMFWNGRYSPTRAMTEDERARPGTTGYSEYQPPTTQPLTNWRLKTTLANNYFMDYEAQRNRRRFSGIPPVKPQDVAMTESMGPIMDRTREHLGTSDAAIIQMRRCIINAAQSPARPGGHAHGSRRPRRVRRPFRVGGPSAGRRLGGGDTKGVAGRFQPAPSVCLKNRLSIARGTGSLSTSSGMSRRTVRMDISGGACPPCSSPPGDAALGCFAAPPSSTAVMATATSSSLPGEGLQRIPTGTGTSLRNPTCESRSPRKRFSPVLGRRRRRRSRTCGPSWSRSGLLTTNIKPGLSGRSPS